MIKGIYTAGRGLDYRIKKIDVVANNLANLNTTGYKREVPFSEILNQYGDYSIKKVTSQQQGDVVQTSNPYDLAISGNGFFAVKTEDGKTELTRDGRFKLNDEGFLVDANQNKVLGKQGEISIEESLLEKDATIKISKSGEIKVGERTIDSILVVNVENPNELTRGGGSNFQLGEESFKEVNTESYSIAQGFIEESNTNPIAEMESMISINKEYETTQKIMNALDSSLGQANEIGKV
jgi:flagellar basal-body rod protein FlgF